MKSLTALITALALSLSVLPAAAQTLDILLPDLTFPSGTVTGSTKGCAVSDPAPVCVLPQE
jgi:hypothetical protein